MRQIETHLRNKYGSYWLDSLDDDNNLSRLLARHAIDVALGPAAVDGVALVEITDGEGDRGIDAIAVDDSAKLVVVVQSKWRKDGTGSIDLGSVLKFVDGVRYLLDFSSEGIPTCSPTTKVAVRTAMQTPGTQLVLVLATTASNALAEEVNQPISDLLATLNDAGDDRKIATASVYTQGTFFDALAQPQRKAVDLEVHMLDWGRTLEPVPAFYGRANAVLVADWFSKHGVSLFAENIRVVLPRSEINEGILRTVTEEPEKFWYYNNGITILASKIERSLAGSTNRDAGYFKLKDASVINGAQTVSTLGRAAKEGLYDSLGRAYVAVRCIEVASDDADLSRRITRFANTQNVVSSQDFAFLDDEQHRLAKELRVLGFDYILRAGEVSVQKDPEKAIDVRQAAVALACASTELSHVVLAKREVSRLFDREGGPYRALFNPTTNGLLLHRAVQVVRAVDARMDEVATTSDNLRAGVAVNGRRMIAHVILNRIGKKLLSSPDFDFSAAYVKVSEDADRLLDAITVAFPTNSYPGNVFKNQARCAELLKVVA
ncbi:AIPR family protein [Dactylosporangium sp. CA-092794]|uniref:AIPR family protein n=1 Tax=Dactylosporangium sp. CA-092794 TaxID=3239929 RepID=UPI003D930BA3